MSVSSQLPFARQKILITGGQGFVGTYLVKELLKRGVHREQLTLPSSKEFDLREKSVVSQLVQGQDLIIHLAANVGGIGYNQAHPGALFYDNLIMGAHLLEEGRKAGVKKIVAIGTICAYPKLTPVPFQESELWNGYPEETNAPYGLAKKMLLVQAQAYRQEYGLNTIYLLPVNLYGPGDNFDPSSSHVIPALIKKFVEAKKNRQNKVIIWGTGEPTREFLHVADAARGIALATEHYDGDQPVNLGSHFEIKIKELAALIGRLTGFQGKIEFDLSKPDGQPRRKLDVSRAEKEFHFRSEIPFETGLQETISWYQQQHR